MLRIEVYRPDEVPPLLQAQAEVILNRIWEPPEGLSSWSDHDPAAHPVSMFLLEESLVLATLEILSLPLQFDGATFAVSGLTRVRTLPERQGEGHGQRLVRASYHLMRDSGADVALFTCDTELHPFYEHAGFEWLRGTVLEGGTRHFPFPSDQPGLDKAVMASFYTPLAQAHRAAFVGARIPLYPGEIDLLW